MSETILNQYDAESANYESYQNCLVGLIQDFLRSKHIQTHSVTGRVKTRASLSDKVNRPNKDYKLLSDITDICGVRIITYLPDDVDKVAGIIEKEFSIDKANSIDKRLISDPDRFGYLSLHYVVSMPSRRIDLLEYSRFKDLKAEIQIRTIIQHAWAEIEHDLGYKSEIAMPKTVKRKFFRLAALLELADGEFQTIKDSIVEYKKAVEQNIETAPETVEIDATSLAEFLKGEVEIKKCEDDIAFKAKLRLYGVKNKDVQQYASYLKWVGILTIDDLKKQFTSNSKLIAKVAAARLTDHGDKDDPTIPRGISLLYLCYVKLTEKNDLGVFIEFFERFNFGSSDESKATFAREIMDAVRASGKPSDAPVEGAN